MPEPTIKSFSRALTPEELEEQYGYVPPLPTDVPVREPGQRDGVARKEVNLMPEQVGEEFINSPTEIAVDEPKTKQPPVSTTQPNNKPSINWQKLLNEARARGDEERRNAAIIGIGEDLNAAFTKRPLGQGIAPKLREQAGIHEKRVMWDMALAQKNAATQVKGAVSDPNSPDNVSFREAVRARFPTFAKNLGASFNALTRPSLEKMLGLDQKDRTLQSTTQFNDGKLRIAQKNAQLGQDKFAYAKDRDVIRDEQTDRRQDETERNNRFNNDVSMTNATRIAQSYATDPNTGRSPVDTRKLPAHLQALSSKTSNFSEAEMALKTIDGFLPGLTDGKLPKEYPLNPVERFAVKKFGGALAGKVKDTEAALQQATSDMAKIVQQIRSGLTVTEAEKNYYEQTFGDKVFADPVLMANALKWYKGLIYKKLATIQQGFQKTGNPDLDKFSVLDDWENIPESISYRDQFWMGVGGPGNRRAPGSIPTPQPAPTPVENKPQVPAQTPAPAPAPAPVNDTVTVISPDGVEGTIPRANLQKALERGYKLK